MAIKYGATGLHDSTDDTKIVAFDASGVTTGTTRTVTVPDGDVDLTGIGSDLKIDSSGNVGIGTTAPSEKLHLYGNEPKILWHDDNGYSFEQYVDSSGTFHIYRTGVGERIVIDNSGNMGLGVTPESWHSNYTVIDISATGSLWSGAGATFLTDNAYYDGSWKYRTTDQATAIKQESNGQIQFEVASSGSADAAISWTVAMTIANDGDVLLGDDPSTSGNAGKRQYASTGEMRSSVKATSGLEHFSFRNPNGKVGNIYTSGSTTVYGTSSDYRLKENVTPLTGAIDRLNQLKPSRFNFITDPTVIVDGFLAHEAQTIVPEAISGEKDAMTTEEYEVTPAIEATYDEEGNELTPAVDAVMDTREVPDYQGIDQAKLVPLLTAALQEAIVEIESLKTRITTLEAV